MIGKVKSIWLLRAVFLLVFFAYLEPVIDRLVFGNLGTWYVYVMFALVLKTVVLLLGLWLIEFSTKLKS